MFTSSTTYDALNRPVDVYHAGRQRLSARPTTKPTCWSRWRSTCAARQAATAFVTNIDYNAKGQRELIDYGNGVSTTYDYDAQTFRLSASAPTRPQGLNGLAASALQ